MSPVPPGGQRCTIEVCTKKNCWRDGGRELWQTLEEKIAAAGLRGTVKLEGVRCLDQCKHSPVMAVRGQHYRRCDATTAAAVITRLAQRSTR